MSKWPLTCAALAVTALIALPALAEAAPKSATAGVEQAGPIEVSAARRHSRRHLRVTVRPHWRGRTYSRRYYAAPYVVHPFDLYAYRRPYFVPGGPPVGPGPFGAGTGAYGFGYQ